MFIIFSKKWEFNLIFIFLASFRNWEMGNCKKTRFTNWGESGILRGNSKSIAIFTLRNWDFTKIINSYFQFTLYPKKKFFFELPGKHLGKSNNFQNMVSLILLFINFPKKWEFNLIFIFLASFRNWEMGSCKKTRFTNWGVPNFPIHNFV